MPHVSDPKQAARQSRSDIQSQLHKTPKNAYSTVLYGSESVPPIQPSSEIAVADLTSDEVT